MVILDKNGDREPDFTIADMDPDSGNFVKIAEVLNIDNGSRVTYYSYFGEADTLPNLGLLHLPTMPLQCKLDSLCSSIFFDV